MRILKELEAESQHDKKTNNQVWIVYSDAIQDGWINFEAITVALKGTKYPSSGENTTDLTRGERGDGSKFTNTGSVPHIYTVTYAQDYGSVEGTKVLFLTCDDITLYNGVITASYSDALGVGLNLADGLSATFLLNAGKSFWIEFESSVSSSIDIESARLIIQQVA